jgi:hypothetical protein
MKDKTDPLVERIETLEREVAGLKARAVSFRGIRRRSSRTLGGLPLYDIALGPDPATGEMRGRARGVIAIGDIATGVLALGGVARGAVAIGGLAAGIVLGIGGLSTGLLALGGLAIGGIALGGGAIGVIAVGGGALGYYAVGGAALGGHVISGLTQDPEAVRFFNAWLPGLRELLARP